MRKKCGALEMFYGGIKEVIEEIIGVGLSFVSELRWRFRVIEAKWKCCYLSIVILLVL